MERRLVAILDADAVGYSRWMGSDEEAAFVALSERREIIDATIMARCGRIFGSAGDSVVAEFSSSVEATRCAIQIQNELRKLNESVPETEQMDFRIGVNFGDVIANNGDLIGDGVNVAERIESLAPAGGVCISSQVAEQISGKLNADFVCAGRHKLKNIDRPVEVWCWPPDAARALRRSAASWRKAVVVGGLVAGTATAVGYVLLYAGNISFPAVAVKEPATVADRLIAEERLRRAAERYRLEELRKTTAARQKADSLAAEVAYWNSVKDTGNPKLLQSYLDRFPLGLYAALADHLIEQARNSAREAARNAAAPSGAAETNPLEKEDPALTLKLQTALFKLGCGPVHIDGRWDWRSQKALENFAKHAKLKMPGDAVSLGTLKLLQRQKGRVCPPTCRARYVLRNGRCVAKKCPKGRLMTDTGACVVAPKRPSRARKMPLSRDRRSSRKPKKKARRRGVPFGGTRIPDCDFLSDIGQAPC